MRGRASALESEQPGRVEVSAAWLDATAGKTLDGAATITARITNAGNEERLGELAIVASGLDGQLVERKVADFRLVPGATTDVPVVLNSLPIQSETSAPFVSLQVSMKRSDGHVSRVSSEPLYYVSREFSGAAQAEGFAHAFATRAFNNWVEQNGTFVYYKPFLAFGVSQPPVPVNMFTDFRWMESFCTAEGRGVELDWVTFFYRVSAEFAPNYTPFTKLFDIYRRTCSGNTTTNCTATQDPQWAGLLANALALYGGSSSDPRFVRFRDTGIGEGVDH
jgi:hypothetical protein